MEELSDIDHAVFVDGKFHKKMLNGTLVQVKEDDVINVRVIGTRFELNDKYISIIAELLNPRPIKPKLTRPKTTIKPKLIIKS